jgi:hypothetical protein
MCKPRLSNSNGQKERPRAPPSAFKKLVRAPSDVFGPGGAWRNACADWWWSAYALSIAAAISGAALTCFAWYEAFQQENRLADHELSARASDHLLALQNGIDQYINDISALRAAFQASEHGISRREFQSLSDDLFRDKPAIFGTSWAPRVVRGERSAHELEASREGLKDYGIKTMAADGSLNPAKDADEYFPIYYSSRRDFGAYGLDINDGGIRQRSLEPRGAPVGRPPARTSLFAWARAIATAFWSRCRCIARACLMRPLGIGVAISSASSKAFSKRAP